MDSGFEKRLSRFADLDGVVVVLNRRNTKYEFRDDELKNRPGIQLDRYTDPEIAKLGRKVIPMMSSGFTLEGAAAVLLLAYHLRSPGSRYRDYVFTDGDAYTTTEDKRFHDYPDRLITAPIQGPKFPNYIAASNPSEEEAAVYSYIAASMLRLFAKPAANYVRSWNHIIDSFANFFGKSANMYTRVIPAPNVESIKGLVIWFTGDNRAKITLYRLLHMSNADQQHIGMKRFLYDMHLSYTGMHIVTMLDQLCKLLNCGPGIVVDVFKTAWDMERQVKCLNHILELQGDVDGEGHGRRMWRYGRLFDENFMADLQTKACPKLVCIFAEALRSEAPEANNGIFQIAQLADVSEDMKKRWAVVAQRMLKIIKASKESSN